MKTVIYGGELHKAGVVYKKGYVVIENGRFSSVRDVSTFSQSELERMAEQEGADNIINAAGKIVGPGLIELHTHGFNGVEFLDTAPGSLESILKEYPKYGITSVSPTIVTDKPEKIKAALENIGKKYERGTVGAALLPVHLECRYFTDDEKTKGAHKSSLLIKQEPNKSMVETVLKEVADFDAASGGFIGIVTIDPSLQGAHTIIEKLKGKGYTVAVGHTPCTAGDVQSAIAEGAALLTHGFNCISADKDYQGKRLLINLQVRNALGPCLDTKKVYAEIVPDLVHVNEHYVRMLINRKGIEYTILVTDACAAAGSKRHVCRLGEEDVFVKEKDGLYAAYYKNNTLCGSVLTMDEAVRKITRLGYSLNDVFRMASLNAARALGVSDRGSIAKEKIADVVIYEKAYDKKGRKNIGSVCCTIANGNIAYQAENFQVKAAALKAA